MIKTRLIFLSLKLLVFASFLSSVQSQSSECYTKQFKLGKCVPVEECKFYFDRIITAKHNIRNIIFEMITNERCGFEGKKSLVCCTDSENSKPSSQLVNDNSLHIFDYEPNENEISSNNANFDLPNIENHPNLKLLPTDCGDIIEDRIIKGENAGITEFPWMALLSYKTGNTSTLSFRCGGSIINERHILTAAHCVTNLKNMALVGVRLGEYDLKTNPDCDNPAEPDTCYTYQDFAIEKVIPHPGFLRNSPDDIALIRLRKPIKFGNNIFPICLPITKSIAKEDLSGKNLIVAGWGATENARYSTILQKVELPVIKCLKNYNGLPTSHKQLCAGKPNGKDSAAGDSGGPLQNVDVVNGVQRYVQHALVSFGVKKFSVSPRISYYMDWILDQLS